MRESSRSRPAAVSSRSVNRPYAASFTRRSPFTALTRLLSSVAPPASVIRLAEVAARGHAVRVRTTVDAPLLRGTGCDQMDPRGIERDGVCTGECGHRAQIAERRGQREPARSSAGPERQAAPAIDHGDVGPHPERVHLELSFGRAQGDVQAPAAGSADAARAVHASLPRC